MAMFSVDKNLACEKKYRENCRKQTDGMMNWQMKFKIDKCKIACTRKTIPTLYTR